MLLESFFETIGACPPDAHTDLRLQRLVDLVKMQPHRHAKVGDRHLVGGGQRLRKATAVDEWGGRKRGSRTGRRAQRQDARREDAREVGVCKPPWGETLRRATPH